VADELGVLMKFPLQPYMVSDRAARNVLDEHRDVSFFDVQRQPNHDRAG
jgi:hypothetical protein